VTSPDGTRIALQHGRLDHLVSGANGGAPRQVRSGGDSSSFSALFWSPDSKRVTYQRRDFKPLDREVDPKWTQLEGGYRYRYESVDVETGRLAAQLNDFAMTSACGLSDGRVLFLRRYLPDLMYVHELWELRTDPGTEGP
jgi:hypothetical protein